MRLADRAVSRISNRDERIDLRDAAANAGWATDLAGRSVLIAPRSQIAAGAALVALDGVVRRLTIAPPDLKPEHLAATIEDAEIDTVVVSERDEPRPFEALPVIVMPGPGVGPDGAPRRPYDTEWVMTTSGTSGRPKLVAHTLAALTGAIGAVPNGRVATRPVWSTFYDIRRYGGLQIFLRAVLGAADLVLSTEGEGLGDHLRRLGAAGVTAISGTPSHWRRVLMSAERGAFAPAYIRLSGEIADQMVLDGLRAAFPAAAIGHAYASTEAGVGFAVDDGREGFPAGLLDRDPGDADALRMTIVEGSLRIKSSRAASRYLGAAAPPLLDADGFVDTGDLVERKGDRILFVGRRGGIINVGGLKVNPEEVEAAIAGHAAVRMVLVAAKKNPLTGAIVTAEVVLREGVEASDALKAEILEACRATLDRHKVPAILRFVPSLALTPGGKLSRVPGVPTRTSDA